MARHRSRWRDARAEPGKVLVERLPIYPRLCARARHAGWRPSCATRGAARERCRGLGARRRLVAGRRRRRRRHRAAPRRAASIRELSAHRRARHRRARGSIRTEIVRLFAARGADYAACHRARPTRCAATVSGDVVRYVVNRNINYTNICYLPLHASAPSPRARRTRTCAARPTISRSTRSRGARGEAWAARRHRGLHAGRHPSRLHRRDLSRDLRARSSEAVPGMHVHAFSPLEVTQGARDARACRVADFLAQLKEAGLGTLPGTAAEILDDEVRADHLPRQDQHRANGSTCMRGRASSSACARPSTIMFGHVERR